MVKLLMIEVDGQYPYHLMAPLLLLVLLIMTVTVQIQVMYVFMNTLIVIGGKLQVILMVKLVVIIVDVH